MEQTMDATEQLFRHAIINSRTQEGLSGSPGPAPSTVSSSSPELGSGAPQASRTTSARAHAPSAPHTFLGTNVSVEGGSNGGGHSSTQRLPGNAHEHPLDRVTRLVENEGVKVLLQRLPENVIKEMVAGCTQPVPSTSAPISELRIFVAERWLQRGTARFAKRHLHSPQVISAVCRILELKPPSSPDHIPSSLVEKLEERLSLLGLESLSQSKKTRSNFSSYSSSSTSSTASPAATPSLSDSTSLLSLLAPPPMVSPSYRTNTISTSGAQPTSSSPTASPRNRPHASSASSTTQPAAKSSKSSKTPLPGSATQNRSSDNLTIPIASSHLVSSASAAVAQSPSGAPPSPSRSGRPSKSIPPNKSSPSLISNSHVMSPLSLSTSQTLPGHSPSTPTNPPKSPSKLSRQERERKSSSNSSRSLEHTRRRSLSNPLPPTDAHAGSSEKLNHLVSPSPSSFKVAKQKVDKKEKYDKTEKYEKSDKLTEKDKSEKDISKPLRSKDKDKSRKGELRAKAGLSQSSEGSSNSLKS